jgi:hypothetical protein
MEIKLLCDCGQKYSFDVDPANRRMPHTVECPICGKDGTADANNRLAQVAPPPLAMAKPALAALAAQPASVAPAPPPVPAPPPPIRPAPAARVVAAEPSMPMGILGAVLGSGLGSAAMYGFYLFAQFRFPLLGIAIGFVTGLGAKLLYKATDNTLGIIAGLLAGGSVFGTLYMMYGGFRILSIISLVVSISVAYRTASN